MTEEVIRGSSETGESCTYDELLDILLPPQSDEQPETASPDTLNEDEVYEVLDRGCEMGLFYFDE